MSQDYKTSRFRTLFDAEGKGERYDRTTREDEDYVTPQKIAAGVANQIEELDLPPPETVVALAIGTGLETAELKKIFAKTRVIGVDLSREMMKVAHEQGRADELHQADITEKTPVEAQSADIVMCCGGTEFNPGKLQNIADEMKRVAKPGAILAITFRPDGQEEARPGFAYYTQSEINDAFGDASFLGADESRAFSMMQQATQDGNEYGESAKVVHVTYNTSYYQMPSAEAH